MGQKVTVAPFALKLKQTRALTCSHLCSCPPDEMLKCLFLLRLGLKA